MPPASVRRQACQPGGRPHTPGLRAAASRSPTEARPPASATHRSPSRRRAAGSSASPRSLPASSSRRPASSRPAAPTPSAVPAPGQTPPRALPRSGAWAYLDRLECSGRAFADPYPRNSRSETESHTARQCPAPSRAPPGIRPSSSGNTRQQESPTGPGCSHGTRGVPLPRTRQTRFSPALVRSPAERVAQCLDLAGHHEHLALPSLGPLAYRDRRPRSRNPRIP